MNNASKLSKPRTLFKIFKQNTRTKASKNSRIIKNANKDPLPSYVSADLINQSSFIVTRDINKKPKI